LRIESLQELDGRIGDDGARPKDGDRARVMKRVVVLWWNDAPDHDEDVLSALISKGLLQLGYEREMSCGEGARSDDMNVVLDRLLRAFLRRLEKWSDVDVETQVGKGRGDDLLTSVVSILAHLGHQDTRSATVLAEELIASRAHAVDSF
jgi:hypothetical protein